MNITKLNQLGILLEYVFKGTLTSILKDIEYNNHVIFVLQTKKRLVYIGFEVDSFDNDEVYHYILNNQDEVYHKVLSYNSGMSIITKNYVYHQPLPIVDNCIRFYSVRSEV